MVNDAYYTTRRRRGARWGTFFLSIAGRSNAAEAKHIDEILKPGTARTLDNIPRRIPINEMMGGKKGDFHKFHNITTIKDVTDEVRYLHGEIQSDPSTSATKVPSTDYSSLTRAVEVVALHQANGYSVSTPGSVSNPADEIKRDPEAFARKSIVSRMEEGSEDEKESALVAFVAERALRHGPMN